MLNNVLNYLEASALRFPDKEAVYDGVKAVSYSEFENCAKSVASGLSPVVQVRQPVAVFMNKGTDTLCLFMGIVYTGAFYSLMNPELPDDRLGKMAEVLNPVVIITDAEHRERAEKIFGSEKLVMADTLLDCEIREDVIADRMKKHIDTDPLYLNFTSGSTGVPKGIAVSHKSVIDFMECFTDLFHITSDDVVANQAPFDFDVSVKDIYSSLKTGAKLVIVPAPLFSAPVKLVDYLCDNKVTTMIWAVSALCLISIFHGLDYRNPKTVNKILFSGEVMPYKHLKNWQKHLPDAMFVNLYGPTEITCNCCYHILDKERDYSGGIPVGDTFPNEEVFLLDSEDKLITANEVEGEICVRGTCLALGYYGRPDLTEKAFVQNPANPYYPDRIYRTGDLGTRSAEGELFFSGRKDFQIKYQGHRIELEEIERAIAAIEGIERCCCLFDEKKSRLTACYCGTIEKDALVAGMKGKLPVYMMPGRIRKFDELPMTKNGKIDRNKLKEMV